MKRLLLTATVALFFLAAMGCEPRHDHTHADGHSHGDGHSHDTDSGHDHDEDHGHDHDGDHGHDHDQDGGHDHDHGSDHGHGHGEEGAGRPVVVVTRWTERTELFMEHPALVEGETSRAAIHVTELADFSPVQAGEVVVVLRSAQGAILEFRGGLSRPGIFGVDLSVDQPGFYDMSLRVEAPGLSDLHELDPVRVHAAGEQIEGGDEGDEGISFLKEQQWTLDFGTVPSEIRALRPSIKVPALVQTRPGGEARISAPVPGRVDPGAKVPIPGTHVRSGETLTRILPSSDDLRDASSLQAALVEAEQEHALAEKERERVARLVEASALPSRRLDEAEASLATAAARLDAARQRQARYQALSQDSGGASWDGAFLVQAPFSGVVSRLHFSPGTSVDEDDVLIEIVDTKQLHVVGAVPESRVASLGEVDAGELLVDGQPPLDLSRPVAVGRVIDPSSRTAEVRFAIDGREDLYRVGQSARLRLFLGRELPGTAIPETAVVEDGGRPVVFVQTGGESFERRSVTLGARAGGWVQVSEGLDAGERVVHEGAYLVRLAAMSTQIPAHGHVH